MRRIGLPLIPLLRVGALGIALAGPLANADNAGGGPAAEAIAVLREPELVVGGLAIGGGTFDRAKRRVERQVVGARLGVRAHAGRFRLADVAKRCRG